MLICKIRQSFNPIISNFIYGPDGPKWNEIFALRATSAWVGWIGPLLMEPLLPISS